MFTQKNLIYHRGRHGYVERNGHFVPIAENSLPAFSAAIDAGATMIELDARKNPLGAPHHPVILHDADVKDGAPTIVEALDLIQARCAVNIEIKDPAIWQEVMALVSWYTRFDGWDPKLFVISSFHHPTVMRIKKHHSSIRVGAIMDAVPMLSYVTMLRRGEVDNLHVESMNADMDMQNDGALMKHARKLGMHIWVWTVNDLATAKRVHDWGAERVFTDRPNIFPT